MDDVPGFRLRGTVLEDHGSRLHRAEALGSPGRPLMLEVHDLEPEDEKLEELRRQTEVIAALGHPGLLPVREIVTARGWVTLVMPAVSGGSLEEVLDGAGGAHLAAETVDAISTALHDAVAAAHASGVHHGALTAAQVHFDGGGHPVILGFGSAALRGSTGSIDDAMEADRRDLEHLLERCRSRIRTRTAPPVDRAAVPEPPGAPENGPVRYRLVLAAVGTLVTPALLAGISLVIN